MAEFHWFTMEGIEGRTDIACQRLAMAMAGIDGFELWRPFDVKESASRRSRRNSDPRIAAPPPKPRRIARFGRYFFVRLILTDSVFHELKNAPYVRGFVCAPGSREPYPVPEGQIQFLRDNLPEKPPTGWEDQIYKGKRVTVAEGPFKGRSGLVKTFDKRGVLKVDLDNKFGSPVPIIIEVGHVLEAVGLMQSPKADPQNDRSTRLELSSAGA